MKQREAWRFSTLRGELCVIRRWDLTDEDDAYVVRRGAVRGLPRGWSRDPLQRRELFALHHALTGHGPSVHEPEATRAVVDRIERAFEDREVVALYVPDLALTGALGGIEDIPDNIPSDPFEPDQPTEDEQPRIVAVEWVEGTATIASGTQWVNLSRDAKWVDGTRVTSIDRCGQRPWVKVRFDRPGAHHFKIKLVPDPSSVVYTGAEKGRSANFTYEERELDFNTAGDGTKVIEGDLFLTVASKASYKLKAKDDYGHEVESGALTAKRLVYYLELPMQGLTSVATSLGTMTGEFASHDLVMVAAGRQEMAHLPNISRDAADNTAFENNARTAYQAAGVADKEPYLIAVAYTDHLAVKAPNQPGQTVATVGPGQSAVDITFYDPHHNEMPLWNNIVPGEDWFVSAQYTQTGPTPAAPMVIPRARCSLVPATASVPDDARTVRVDVSWLPPGTGDIDLVVHGVALMRAGVALGNGNAVCVCTRAFWRSESNAQQNAVMIHEIGHKVGMVPNGTGVDRSPTQYDESGHRGSHCHNGITARANYGGVAGSTCVMFGETNGLSAFCANCQPGVRKNDLSAGWRAF